MAANKPKYDSKELQEHIDAYFLSEPAKPTVTGLAYFLGFESRQSMYDYKEREASSYTIKRAILYIEAMHEKNLYGNAPTGSIFWLKNRDWKDNQNIDHTTLGKQINKVELTVLRDGTET